jgi:hypothetical protein
MPVISCALYYQTAQRQIRDDNGDGEEAGPQAWQRYVEEHAFEPASLGREYDAAPPERSFP